VPFLAAGYGGRTADYEHGGTHTKGAFNYGGGVKYFLTESLAIRGDVRHLIFKDDVNSTISENTLNNVEYNVGLSFIFGGAKPAPAPVVAPPPPPAAPSASLSASPASVTKGQNATLSWSSQNTSDCSIQPDIGKVPTQGTRTVTPSVNTSYILSCTGPGGSVTSDAALAVAEPPKPAPVDTDKDGVTDDLDQCPNTPAGVAVDKVGCPLDSDKDGVPDYLDKCPGTPAGVKVDKDGCPLDSDKDGVPDYLDKCPDTPAGYVVDKDGCPPPPEKLCIKLEVEFDTGKADVKKKYHDEIGKVAEFLKTYPDSTGTIEGHTDNVGGADMNMKLSQRRADSIRQYLVDNYGIAAERLSAKGYGLTKPVADNKTAAGRQKNRRINASFDCVVIPKKK